MNPLDAIRQALAKFFTPEKTTLYADGVTPEAAQKVKRTGPGFDGPMLQPKGSGGPVQQAIETMQPQQTAAPQQGAGFRLSVPGDNGKMVNLPPEIAQQIGNVFDKEGNATAAAQVLVHPNQQTRLPDEIARLGENYNRGENPDFTKSNIDIPNPNGSIDRGLFRINDQTFAGMQSRPFWNQAMKNKGITNWNDM